jgi:calcium-translocating P-type ATPase
MLKILLIALAINCVFITTGDGILETFGIALAILIAVIVSTISERASNAAFEKLQGTTQNILVRVIRGGAPIEIPIADIVVGDLVLLSTGDKIAADGTVVSGHIEVDQSVLNGESEPASMDIRAHVHGGTVVTSGNATIQITGVGDNTFYGKMAAELKAPQPKSPLKVKLEKLAKMISIIGYIGSALVACSYIFHVLVIDGDNFTLHHLINVATLVVSVIVMAVPEGLPMMIAVVLSRNVKSMMRDNVLVRKLNGIETAGSMNILFTDKTGTLTMGKLQVTRVITDDMPAMATILKYNTMSQMSGTHAIGGNFTDRILLEYAQTLPFRTCAVASQVPFQSATKFMSTTLENGEVLLKGAPEVILKMTPNADTVKIMQTVTELTQKAFRVIACAIKEPNSPAKFVGLVAIRDNTRPEAHTAIKKLQSAGVQTVMITGDARETAIAVAREVGILGGAGLVLTSDELSNLTDTELSKILPNLRVVARALPTDKSRLVRIAQNLGLVVGMTGDGVNDSPALKAADVGFAMGSGTEVAKEAGDVVIIDDNINSIARATSYGRTIFKSIRKFLIFKLTINFVAMFISIFAPFMGIGVPITVLQMLWINIVMDTLAGLAYGGERPQDAYMVEPPKKRTEPIINRYMWGQIIYSSIFISALSIWFLTSSRIQGEIAIHGTIYAMTAFFAFFMFINIFNAFNSRTHDINPIRYLALNKPFIYIMAFVTLAQILLIFFGGSVFRTVPLDWRHFIFVTLLALSIIPVDMLRKLYLRRRYGDKLLTT